MSKIQFGCLITELPKSTLPASAASEGGPYLFICSSSIPKATDSWMQNRPAVVMGTGGVASVNFGVGQFSYSTDTWAFRSNTEEYSTEFLYRKIQQNLSKIEYAGFEGSGLRHLRKDFVKSLIVDMPEPSVASKITRILRVIDKTIEKTETLIKKYHLIKAGLMQDLFTRGVTSDGKLRPKCEQAPEIYQETPLGWIPKEWNVALLDDIAKRGSGHTPSQSYPEYWNGGIKWLSLADSWRMDNYFVAESEKNISSAGLANSSASMLPAGTVVVTRDGSRLGKSAILKAEMAVSQHFMAWTCGSSLDNLFLYWTLQHRKREFENVATGSTIPTIGLQFFKRFLVAHPDIGEQKRIASVLGSCHEKIVSTQRELEKLNLIKSGIMHDLLTYKVKLVPEQKGAAHV